MNGQKLGPIDIGAIVASGLLVVGCLLPFWTFDFGDDYGFGISADFNFLDTSGGFLAVLAGGAAIVLTVKTQRVGAIACLAGAGLLMLLRVIEYIGTEYMSMGVGVYAMLAGIVGGIVCHAIGLASPDRAAGSPQAWTPPPPPTDLAPPAPPRGFHGSSRPKVDPDDPFHIVQ